MAACKKKMAPERWARSTCPYCGVRGRSGGKVRQDRRDPGRSFPSGELRKLCPKPAGLPEAVHHPDRLTYPLRRRPGGGFERITWDDALGEVAEKERHARHINERVHGNIQNDGTFSIVPRTRSGVTTADELRRIADVAEKYEARMIKITGAQRLDILGVKKEDLPKAWEDLDMSSGYAYGKAFRQVKTCVGSDFCRFGVGDSTTLGIEMEKTFENLNTPAKVKMAASGCPRNCAEATVKDVGVVAVEGGKWQIWIGGAAGMDVRKGDLLATVDSPEEAMKATQAFFQYYRENGRWKERAYDFVPRVGLKEVKKRVLAEDSGEPEKLRERLAEAKAASFDPWQERKNNKTKNQFAGVVNDG